ncbi:MAG: hypothetical protein ACC658_10220, partial [Acidimicrobiia bacterium]
MSYLALRRRPALSEAVSAKLPTPLDYQTLRTRIATGPDDALIEHGPGSPILRIACAPFRAMR